ncbi:MAG TPA: hypothetical protein VLC09_01035, partial [Polyangiaceae bacterium]|nr:hypothetical protein [Polyangiaceae bacterium]
YWTRSSPDGRFVAYGLASGTANGNAEVFDLERDAAVPVMALYDPAFFPDGSGWVLQGGDRNTCSRSVLTSEPSALTTLETGCAKISEIGLNQSLGAEPSGDYLALDGSFRGDNGGRVATLANPFADFGPAAALHLTSLVFNGTVFQADDTASLTLPDEGNFALSPSGSLVLSRLGSPNDIEQHGYRLRSLAWNEAHTALETTELGHYCINGGDAAFSFDERWIVLHHYVEASDAEELGFTGEDDPAFAEYLSKGASNLYLIETATGLRQRITRMAPGQYALFPHFRSDGWLYFVVRTAGTTTEYIAASDAAL